MHHRHSMQSRCRRRMCGPCAAASRGRALVSLGTPSCTHLTLSSLLCSLSHQAYRDDHLVFETTQTMNDIPYSDHFTVRREDAGEKCCAQQLALLSVSPFCCDEHLIPAKELRSSSAVTIPHPPGGLAVGCDFLRR